MQILYAQSGGPGKLDSGLRDGCLTPATEIWRHGGKLGNETSEKASRGHATLFLLGLSVGDFPGDVHKTRLEAG